MYKYTGVPCPVCIAIIFAKLLYPGNPIILGDSLGFQSSSSPVFSFPRKNKWWD